MKKIGVMLCFILFWGLGFGQLFQEETFNQHIKSARIYIDGNELSYPVVNLYGENQLLFEFDDLSDDLNTYQYEIIHCTSDWRRSDLHADEYIEGFYDNVLSDFDYSNNTTVPFVHYALNIPNDDLVFIKSGNYVIRVFESITQEPIVQLRFYINESLVSVRGEIVKPLGAEYANIAQEVRMSVFHEDLEVTDPFSEVNVEISQNNRPDRIKANVKPIFVRNNELVYGASGEHIFVAGNEFRTFDIKSYKRLGLNVNDIQFADTMYYIQLRLDERRSFKKYFWEEEMNGKYTIFVDNEYDYALNGDYGKVFFELSLPEPFIDGKVYVVGKFNHWKRNAESLMEYNYETLSYEANVDVKQGYYDYCYVFESNYDKKPTDQRVEGAHYQTENDYLIKVYHRGFSDNYDRLVGFRVLNSKYQ